MNASLEEQLEVGLRGNLGSLSIVVSEALAILNRSDVDLSALQQGLAKDQGLTARILRIANSPFYGQARKIASLREATVVLGVHTIRNVVTTAGVMALFSGEGASGFNRLTFWQHAIGTGVAAKVIARRCGKDGETAFTAGLLHDVGKLVIDTLLPDEFQQALQLARERGCLLLEAEHEVLGFDHAYAGRMAAERWRLPDAVTQAVCDHHRQARAENGFAGLVHVGDILCRSLDIGDGGDESIPALDPQTWQRINLQWTDADSLLKEIDELNRQVNLFF